MVDVASGVPPVASAYQLTVYPELTDTSKKGNGAPSQIVVSPNEIGGASGGQLHKGLCISVSMMQPLADSSVISVAVPTTQPAIS